MNDFIFKKARQAFCGILLIWVVVAAGPVGRYLGFKVGKTVTDTGFGRDSIHFYLPTPSDSIIYRNFTDTTTVLAEIVRQGAPAYLLRAVMADTGRYEMIDTVCESGETLMRQRMNYGGITLWLNLYRVPFWVGSWWRTGAEGTYYIDINGDSLIDTLTVWGDTVRVLSTEDVTVPYGTVRNCYKLLLVLRQALRMTYQGMPVRETGYVRHYEWYKDSLWRVKDSTIVTARAYARMLIWMRLADIFSYNLIQMTGMQQVALQEPTGSVRSVITVQPNPFCNQLSIRLSEISPADKPEISVYDVTGRCVRCLIGPEAVWDGRDQKGLEMAPGVYFIRVKDISCLVRKIK